MNMVETADLMPTLAAMALMVYSLRSSVEYLFCGMRLLIITSVVSVLLYSAVGAPTAAWLVHLGLLALESTALWWFAGRPSVRLARS